MKIYSIELQENQTTAGVQTFAGIKETKIDI